MSTHKISSIVAIIILLIIGITNSWAGGAEESSSVNQLTLARFFGDAGDVGSDIDAAIGEAGIIQAIINAFDEEHDAITVNDLSSGWGEYYDALKANFASGSAPDVFVLHTSRLLEFTDVGALADIGADIASVGVDINDWADEVRAAVSVNGAVYAVPMDAHANLWHVNVDLMKQAGLVDSSGVPLQPKSVAELLSHAEQFKQATGKHYLAADFSQFPIGVRLVLSFMWQQGANVFEGNRVNINTPEAKRAVETILSLFDNDYADPTLNYADSQQKFLNGDVGVLVNGTWVVDFYDAQAKDTSVALSNYEVQSFPTLFQRAATWGDSHVWAIPSTLKNDTKKYENALKLLAWIYEHNYDWSRTGHLSVSKSVLESARYNQLPHRNMYKSTVDIINNVTPTKKSGAIQDVLNRELFAIWLTGKSVDKALADADVAITDIMAE